MVVCLPVPEEILEEEKKGFQRVYSKKGFGEERHRGLHTLRPLRSFCVACFRDLRHPSTPFSPTQSSTIELDLV